VERPTLPSLTTAEANPTAGPSESSEKSPPPSTENLIADLKAALSRPGSQRSYAAVSKISESVNQSNIREVVGFAETLPREQDKNVLRSVLLGRWAEFDAQAAVAYAQALPNRARNSAVSSVIAGWAEHDFAGASAWTQQLSPGPLRDQAM